MSHQTGITANEELMTFFGNCRNGSVRAVKISIEDGKWNIPYCSVLNACCMLVLGGGGAGTRKRGRGDAPRSRRRGRGRRGGVNWSRHGDAARAERLIHRPPQRTIAQAKLPDLRADIRDIQLRRSDALRNVGRAELPDRLLTVSGYRLLRSEVTDQMNWTCLTRALLGLVRPLPDLCWGGGGVAPPHLSR